jgi:hypothetical protein
MDPGLLQQPVLFTATVYYLQEVYRGWRLYDRLHHFLLTRSPAPRQNGP